MKPYYQDSSCTIYNADNREILPQLGKFDLCLTDPPYGIAQKGGKWAIKFNNPEYMRWDSGTVDNMPQIMEAGETAIIWGGNYYPTPPARCWLTWFKPDAPPSLAHFEMAWTNLDRTARQISCSIAQTNAERVKHPTQKPLAVMLWCLSFVPDAKTVIDPFMGSGTTLVAAKQLGRISVGIEMEERYCAIAAQRLSQTYLQLNDKPVKNPEPEMLLWK